MNQMVVVTNTSTTTSSTRFQGHLHSRRRSQHCCSIRDCQSASCPGLILCDNAICRI